MRERIEINANAVLMRKELGEDQESPVDIFSLVISMNDMTILFYPLGERISGLCVHDSSNKVIAINSLNTYGRQRFTLAHELCHIRFHTDISRVICPMSFDVNNQREIEANEFASFFLAPYEALKSFIESRLGKKKGDLQIDDIVKIEQHFGMSRHALLWRLQREGYISQEEALRMRNNVIRSATRLGYDDTLYRPSPEEKTYFSVGKYIRLAEVLKEKGLISAGKYEELLMDGYRPDIVYGIEPDDESAYD